MNKYRYVYKIVSLLLLIFFSNAYSSAGNNRMVDEKSINTYGHFITSYELMEKQTIYFSAFERDQPITSINSGIPENGQHQGVNLNLKKSLNNAEVLTVYITFTGDMCSEATINWHTNLNIAEPEVRYRKEGEEDWQLNIGNTIPFPDTDRFIHRNNLAGLSAGSVYEIRAGGDSKIYNFKTLPDELTEPLTFLVGGDLYQSTVGTLTLTTQAAATHNPLFAVLAGDLAQCDSDPARVGRWFVFFDNWLNNMTTSGGRLIPIVPGIGNHENSSTYNDNADNCRYFYEVFQVPHSDGVYYTVKAGNYLTIIMLDSGHTKPVAGHQTEWLEAQLIENSSVPYVFPVSHVGAYPSSRNFNNENQAHPDIRRNWVPLYEKYGIKVAFEHHEHLYKRTFPLKNNQIDPEGIVYIGDGGWGASTRTLNQDAWYIERSRSINNFNKVELTADSARITGIANINREIDTYTFAPSVSTSAENHHSFKTSLTSKTRLHQNFPNPVSYETTIQFEIPQKAYVQLRLYNVFGQLVKTLASEHLHAGSHEVTLSKSELPSGIYFYRLEAGNEVLNRQMILTR